MWVDVRIPYSESGKLADAYNQALQESSANWILFLDHDVFLANPLWYEIIQNAIEILSSHDPKAAVIGCRAGGERHKRTMRQKGEPNDSIEYHIQQSMKRYWEHRNSVVKINEHVAGYFLLVNKDIAKTVGFRQVKAGINNIDQDFGARILESGYNIYELPGLYIYHRRGMKHLQNEFRNG